MEEKKEYFINNPIFIKIKKRLNFKRLSFRKEITRTLINERIIEIPFVFQHLPLQRNITIVDLGCVESPLSMYCASLGYRVVGIDLRTYPYIHPNFNFIRADLLRLPLADKCCNIVLAISTIEHIGLGFYKDPIDEGGDYITAKEIYRILKSNGKLFFSAPFGKRRITPHQRIYDYNSILDILDKFKIRSINFYVNKIVDSTYKNYWIEVPRHIAEESDSSEGAHAVVILEATK